VINISRKRIPTSDKKKHFLSAKVTVNSTINFERSKHKCTFPRTLEPEKKHCWRCRPKVRCRKFTHEKTHHHAEIDRPAQCSLASRFLTKIGVPGSVHEKSYLKDSTLLQAMDIPDAKDQRSDCKCLCSWLVADCLGVSFLESQQQSADQNSTRGSAQRQDGYSSDCSTGNAP